MENQNNVSFSSSSKVNYALSLNLKFSQASAAQKEIFHLFDEDKNGTISQKELELFQRNFGKGEVTQEAVDNYINTTNKFYSELGLDLKLERKIAQTPKNAEQTSDNSKILQEILDKYSYENLKKLYPEDKYEIKSFDDDYINVYDIKTNEQVFFKLINKNGMSGFIRTNEMHIDIDNSYIKISRTKPDSYQEIESLLYKNGYLESKTTWDSKGEKTIHGYNKNGDIEYTEVNNVRHYPLVDELTEDISAKDYGIIPTTRNSLKSNLDKLTTDNIRGILDEYETKNGDSLITDILEEVGLGDKRYKYAKQIVDVFIDSYKNEHQKNSENLQMLEKFKKTLYNEIDDNTFALFSSTENIEKLMSTVMTKLDDYFSKRTITNIATKVDNPYYKGKEYDVKVGDYDIKVNNNVVKIEGDIIKIKGNNEDIELDLDKLTYYLDKEDTSEYKAILKQLPAEVLIDMYHEATIVDDTEYFYYNYNAAGRFSPKEDNIATTYRYEYNNSKMTTLVHELGHAMDNTRNNSKLGKYSFEEKYYGTFIKELAASGLEYDGSDDKLYCIKNIHEMFAECYTLLMLGDCQSKDCILKHFPETLENVKKHIEWIREQKQEVRHKK